MEIKHIDNIGDNTIENFLKDVIDENSNVNIVTPRFSIYALHAIQKAISKSKSFNVRSLYSDKISSISFTFPELFVAIKISFTCFTF